jgi:hypothetical protein
MELNKNKGKQTITRQMLGVVTKDFCDKPSLSDASHDIRLIEQPAQKVSLTCVKKEKIKRRPHKLTKCFSESDLVGVANKFTKKDAIELKKEISLSRYTQILATKEFFKVHSQTDLLIKALKTNNCLRYCTAALNVSLILTAMIVMAYK